MARINDYVGFLGYLGGFEFDFVMIYLFSMDFQTLVYPLSEGDSITQCSL